MKFKIFKCAQFSKIHGFWEKVDKNPILSMKIGKFFTKDFPVIFFPRKFFVKFFPIFKLKIGFFSTFSKKTTNFRKLRTFKYLELYVILF